MPSIDFTQYEWDYNLLQTRPKQNIFGNFSQIRIKEIIINKTDRETNRQKETEGNCSRNSFAFASNLYNTHHVL